MSHILLSAIAGILAATSLGTVKTTGLEAQNNKNNQYETIDLKEKVMRSYYDDLNDSIKKDVDFKMFEEGYYKSKLNINDYLNAMKDTFNANGSTTRGGFVSFLQLIFNKGQIHGGDDEDARHIISNFRRKNGTGDLPNLKTFQVLPIIDKYNIDLTWDSHSDMPFSLEEGRDPDIPVYYDREELGTEEEKANYVPRYASLLMPGDIVWDTISEIDGDFGDFINHMGLIVNPCKRGYTRDAAGNTKYFNFVETIEAFQSGVRFGFLDDDRILQCGTRVLRVFGASQSSREYAVNFMLHQYGEKYLIDLAETNYPVPNESRDAWYCTQLVHAAYYQRFGDITYVLNDSYDPVVTSDERIRDFVLGDMIARGRYVYPVEIDGTYTDKFISISEDYDAGSHYWIYNPSYESKVIHYTGSLYNFNDARDNYKKVCKKTVTVEGDDSANVKIPNNVLANTIGAWYTEGNTMYVTLAHKFADCWFESYIKTTIDDITVEDHGTWYEASITNTTDVARNYSIPYDQKLMSYNDAINRNFISTRGITVKAKKTETFAISKDGGNQYFPLVLNKYGNEDNAALIRIAKSKHLYYRVLAASVARPSSSGNQEPDPIVYPKRSMEGTQTFYFDSYDLREFGHGQQDTYLIEIDVPFENIPERDWNSVTYIEFQDFSDANFYNEDIYVNGNCFHVKMMTHNVEASGEVLIRYVYDASLILDSITLSGDYQTSFQYDEYYNANNLVVKAHYTCGAYSVISRDDSNLTITSDYNMYEPGEYTITVKYVETGIEASASYKVVVEEPGICYIALEGDYQTDFYVGDEFNYDGLIVIAYMEDGEVIELEEFTIDDCNVNMSVPGTYEVNVWGTMNGDSDFETYEITVHELVLESITLSGNYQTNFVVGDEFSSDGLVVTAHYNSGASKVVPTGSCFIYSRNLDMNQPGTYAMIVDYFEGDYRARETYLITVEEPTPVLTSITLSGDYQTNFVVGDSFNYDGLIVTAHYSDGSSRQVTNFRVIVPKMYMIEEGKHSATVSYAEDGVKVYAYYTFIVGKFTPSFKFLTSITLSGDYQTTFYVGERFNYDGLIVTAHYSDGSSEEVKDFEINGRPGMPMPRAGSYTVTVSYTEKLITVEATYTINVFKKGTFPRDPIVIGGKF